MFKVNDKVRYGTVSQDDTRPIFDFDYMTVEGIDESEVVMRTGVVVRLNCDKNGAVVEFVTRNDDKGREWIWQVSSKDAHMANNKELVEKFWPRLLTDDAKVAIEPEPIWTESVAVSRRQDVPDSVLARMIDAGERGVRRITRFWPDNQKLTHSIKRTSEDIQDRVTIAWRWEKIEE